MHRVGGLEKEDGTGNVSYDAENHDAMVRIRAAKIAGIANDIPPVDLDDEDGAEILVLSWGGTWGAAKAAVGRVRGHGRKIAHAHLRHMNPFPADLGDVVRRYPEDLRARDQPRAALALDSRGVPGRRAQLREDVRRPVPRRRPRRAILEMMDE